MEQKPNRNDNRFLREDKSMKNMMIVCVAAVAMLGCGAHASEPEALPSFAKDGRASGSEACAPQPSIATAATHTIIMFFIDLSSLRKRLSFLLGFCSIHVDDISAIEAIGVLTRHFFAVEVSVFANRPYYAA